jgi:hypothetical protein
VVQGGYEYFTVGDAAVGFGEAVSMDGDYAIIGAPGGKCVYVYTRNVNDWKEPVELPESLRESDRFGLAILRSPGEGKRDHLE